MRLLRAARYQHESCVLLATYGSFFNFRCEFPIPVNWRFMTCTFRSALNFRQVTTGVILVTTGVILVTPGGSADRIRYAPSVVVNLAINPDRAST